MLESLKNDFQRKHKKDLKTQKCRWIVIKMSKNVSARYMSVLSVCRNKQTSTEVKMASRTTAQIVRTSLGVNPENPHPRKSSNLFPPSFCK